MTRPANVYSLVADIGGTNTRVALADVTQPDGKRLLPETVRKFKNANFPGLESVLNEFLALEDHVDCSSACVAVAGPVRAGRGSLTNLDWTIDEAGLSRATQAETVAILNDLQAQGHALGLIEDARITHVVPDAPKSPGEAELVIGIGTGFNVAPVHPIEGGRLVAASEAGHANMPVRCEEDLRICQFIETVHGVPGVEDVLSGRGLERIFAFVSEREGPHQERKAADIMAACADGSDPLAARAVEVFVRILGTVVGNQALIHLPFGGIYLVGGVARAMVPYLDRFGFTASFRDKGRFSGFMNNFSVSVIEDDFAALNGSAAYLAQITK